MEELLKKYDFIIDGNNNHWYRFKFTNSISIFLDRDKNQCVLAGNEIDRRHVIIKSFNILNINSLKLFLDGIFSC